MDRLLAAPWLGMSEPLQEEANPSLDPAKPTTARGWDTVKALSAVVGWYLGACLCAVAWSLPIAGLLLIWQGSIQESQGYSVPDFVELHRFREIAPKRGDPSQLERSLERLDPGATVITEGTTGRAALADDWEARGRGGRSTDLSKLFEEAGYRLVGESELETDFTAGLRGALFLFLSIGVHEYWALALGLTTVALFLLYLQKRLRDPFGTPRHLPRDLALGLLLGAVLSGTDRLAALLPAWARAEQATVDEPLLDLARSGELGLWIFTLSVAIPLAFALELFLRGWAVPYLHERAGVATAYLGSSFLYMVLFSANGIADWGFAFCSGLLLVWVYRRTGSIVAPVVAQFLSSEIWFLQLADRTPPF